jgi:1,4-dihydroxy-2-naphthoate octaprenyltransferase
MTSTLGHDGFGSGDFRSGLTTLFARFGQVIGWTVFAGMTAVAVTVALLTTLVIGLVLALAAALLAFGRPRAARAEESRQGLETLEARPTPDGWVIEPSSSAR